MCKNNCEFNSPNCSYHQKYENCTCANTIQKNGDTYIDCKIYGDTMAIRLYNQYGILLYWTVIDMGYAAENHIRSIITGKQKYQIMGDTI